MAKKREPTDPTGRLRIPPEGFIALQLDEMNSRLADLFEKQTQILQHMQETTAEGVDFPIETQTVTSTTQLNLVKAYPYRPIRAIDFFNKGSSTVYIRVNQDAKEFTVEDREQITVTRPRATIRYVTLRVDSGSAVIRMVGHY